MNKTLLMLLVTPLISLTCISTNLAEKAGTIYKQKEAIEDVTGAKHTLEEYLRTRSMGRYEECLDFLSDGFLDKFLQRFGTSYIDYYQHQNEDYYKNWKIVGVDRLDNGLILVSVVVEVEGPGYKSEASESYYMIEEKGCWKIQDWKIDYKK
jgi:hypothetical protein